MIKTETAYKFYIDGQWKESDSGETVAIYSPETSEVVGHVQAITKDEVDVSIQLAKKAQKDWAKKTVRERGDILMNWTIELDRMKHEIADIMMSEIAKGYNDCVKEVERTVDLIRYTISEAIHTYNEGLRGANFPGGSDKKVGVVERVPLGVVLAISPFNYPVNLAAAKVAPALITGNAVIFKPATQGALSGVKMIEALDKAGIPANICNLVTGRGSVIGDHLVTHKGIDMISFTGGTETGLRIAKQASMIPMVFELGGKDPAIILPDADLDFVAKQIIGGAFSYSGQRCTAIKRIFALDETADQLVPLLKAEIEKLTIGSPKDNPVIVPLIDSYSADYITALIDDAIEKGATLVTGNKREGNLHAATFFDHVTTDMRLAWEEPFGPVLPLIRVKSIEEAIELSNASEFGLQASIFTEDINTAYKLAEELECGSVQINGRTERGPDHFPFLGVKNSGLGVQGIGPSLESMTRPKATILNLR